MLKLVFSFRISKHLTENLYLKSVSEQGLFNLKIMTKRNELCQKLKLPKFVNQRNMSTLIIIQILRVYSSLANEIIIMVRERMTSLRFYIY